MLDSGYLFPDVHMLVPDPTCQVLGGVLPTRPPSQDPAVAT